MDFKAEMAARASMVNEALKKLLPPQDKYPQTIHQAMHYSIFTGGKRLRPILCLEGAALIGKDPKTVLPAACAIEMIHTYSLVHDDLPAMDDDDLRRGKPTCHKVFGEAIAILCGDALLTHAFEVLAGLGDNEDLDPKNINRVIRELARAVGSQGMVGGQVIDIESTGTVIDKETLQLMHARKTGQLIQASLKSGAMLFGCDDQVIAALDSYAYHLGIAFQIVDDILDVTGNEEELGKPVGSDARSQKNTYTSVFGLEDSAVMAKHHGEKAITSLERFGGEADFLRKLVGSLLKRRN